MIKNNVLFFIITLSCLMTFNCNPTDNDAHVIAFEIVAEDREKTFQAKIGDEFTIAVNECVGCAQVWRITSQDSSKISLEERTSRNRSCTDCDGGSLTRVFRFKCLQSGSSDLELQYFDYTLKVTIDVQKN